jgi:DNA-binding winged helix-turn-helix (wHTH) protein
MRVEFGEFLFDSDARELTRLGAAVSVPPKALELLRALLAARPRALSRAELNDLLWPETSVGYTSLAATVADLRRILGDDRRRPRFIRTARSHGYAFVERSVREAGRERGARISCGLTLAGREIALVDGENVVGRDASCAVRIDWPTISRRHARILVRDGRAAIEDLGSKNGTLIQGRRIEGKVDLVDGDEVRVGRASLTFHASCGEGVSTASVEPIRGTSEP